MTIDKDLIDRLRARGEEMFTQVSAELMSNPRFMKAMEGAMRGKEAAEDAASRAVKSMNIPTRTEFKKALKRIDALEKGPAQEGHEEGDQEVDEEVRLGMARVAITGTASYLGGRILRRLVESRGADAVVAVDIASPPTTLQGVHHRMVDLTLPGADRRLVDVFEEEEVDTVVHAAFFTDPRRDAAYAHELESIGTLHLAAAAAAAGVRHLLLRSFTAVYGARSSASPHCSEPACTPSTRESSASGWCRCSSDTTPSCSSCTPTTPWTRLTPPSRRARRAWSTWSRGTP
jgi:hypothetical protein